MNSSGKVLIIFLVITAILLISLTAISLFFFQRETERRKLAETTLEEYRTEKAELEEDLQDIKKQNLLLQGKNKEADERVNDLSDELELEKGLREEMKLETVSLKEEIDEAIKTKKEIEKEIKKKETIEKKLTADLSASEETIKELEAQLKSEIERNKKLNELYEQQEQKHQEELSKTAEPQWQQNAASEDAAVQPAFSGEGDFAGGKDQAGHIVSLGVELEEIVVIPGEVKSYRSGADVAAEKQLEETVAVLDEVLEGRILSVDVETEFVIVSLGEKDGLAVGNILSVYRHNDYMGDIKITRLQPEMSAADLILPLSIRNIKKNDQVKIK